MGKNPYKEWLITESKDGTSFSFSVAPFGGISARVDEHGIGHVSDFRLPNFPPMIVKRILLMTGKWMQRKGAVGVIIHVQGKNALRYRSLGFRPVHGLPMLLSAPLDEAIVRLSKGMG